MKKILSSPTLPLLSPHAAFAEIKELCSAEVEEFWVLALNPSLVLLSKKMLFRGTVNECLVHPRDVFRFAIALNACNLIIAHNHPSDDLFPSENDLAMTEKLVAVGQLMQIPVIDHLLVGKNNFASFALRGWFDFTKVREVRMK